MSAVVQELYSGLPAALAAESAALSDPITVFWAKPEASELVLTCSRLPLKPQNTHGLKVRLPDYYPERLACVGNLSCPGWMALLLREPEGTGGPAEGDGTPSGRLTQQGSFQDAPREGLGAAEDMAGVAVKSLVPFPLTSKDAAGSEEKAPWLIQEGRDSFPSPSSTPRAALLQNLEESPAKEQATLSNPMLETPGATADGTRPFSETGEERTRGSVAVIPGSSECSDREVVNAKVPEIGTLVPLESLCLPSDSSTVKGQLPGEEVWECLTTSAPFSAARRTLLCLLQGGGDHLLGPGEGLRAIFNGRLPARQEETDFCDAATSTAAVLERKVPLEASLANRSLEPSAHSLSQSDLGFGTMPWEDSASIQVVCEVQGEEGCAGSNGSLTSSDGGEVELREEWAFEATMEGNLLPSDSSDELSSDGESERGTEGLADHAYSCLGRRTVGGQKVAPEEGGIKEALQKGPPSEKEGPASALKMVSPESSVSRLQDGLRLSPGAHLGSSGSGRVEKNDGSLCPHARVGGLVLGTKGGGTLSGEDDSWCCFRSSLEASEDPHPSSSSSSSSSSSDSVGPDRDLRKGHLLEIKTGSRHGADLLGRSSGAQLHPNRSSGIEVSSVTGKEHSETTPVGGELPLAQQEEEMDLGGLGLTDSRLEGGPLGASAKLVTQNTRDLLRDKEVFSSLCQDGSEGLEQTSEEKVTEVGRAGSPCEESKRDLCVAKEACCTLSEDAPQDGLNEGHRRGASPAFVPERDAPLPWAQGAGDSGACLNDRGHLELLNRVENATGALGPAGPSHPDLSLGAAAEAETQRIDPDESLIESKEIPGHGSSVFTPAANLQQKPRTGTSLVFELDHWGVGETVKTEGGRQGCELAEKPTWARNPEEAALPELAGLVEGQCKEGVEGNPYSGPSFPPESLLSDRRPHLARQGCRGSSWRLADLSPADPEQPRDTTCQMETQLCGPRNQHHLNCPVWFEQKNEALEAAASERSSLPLMSPEKPKVDPVRETVSRSAEQAPKQVSCNRQESEGLILPGSAFFLEKSIREAVQQSTGGPCEKKVPELTKNRSQDDPKELESLKRCLGGLESPCRTLTWNNQPPPVRMEESCPVSAVLSGGPSDVPGEDHFLKWDDKPASPPHPACSRLTDLSFIPVDGERSTRGGLLESFQHQGRGHLAVGRLGAQHLQNPALWFSQRDGPWTGPSSKNPSSPHAEGYSSGTFSIKSEAEGQAGLLVPEKDHTCCSPVQASACVDSAPGPEENGVRSEGRPPGAGRMVSGTLGNPDPSSMETEPSQEEDQRGSRPAPGARGPSAVLVEGLMFPAGEDEKGGEARLPGPASLPECPSESGLAEAQDPSKCTENTEWHEIGPSFPRRNILPETLSESMTFAFRDGCALEASMLGLGRDGRGWQAVEGSGKTPGDPRELPEWLSGSPVNKVPVKTSGAAEAPGSPSLAEKAFGAEAGPVAAQPGGTCAALHQGKRTARKARAGAPSRPRILAVGRPLGSTSFQRVVSPGDLGHWAFLPRSRWRGSEKWGPRSTFWEPGRPKRSQALMGPRQREGGRGPRRLREPLRPSKDKDCPLPGLCLWSTSVGFSSMESRRAFESTPRMKSLLLFQRRACKKVPPPGRRSKAPAEVPPLVSPAPLRPPSGMVPRPGSQQADPVCSAFPLAAGRSEGAAAWDSPPKHRGLPGSSWNPFGLSGCAKDPPLLRKLSLLADRLQGPPRKPPKTKPLRPSSELLPVPEKCHSLRSQELPEIFSCVSLQLASPWGKGGHCCFRVFSSRPLALCPIEATRACFLGLNGKAPLAFGGPVFPVSFHPPTDPGPVRDLLGREGLQSVSPRVSPGQAPGWTFAFLLSRSCLDITPTTQKDAHVSSLSTAKAQLGAAVAQNIRGLQTVLALVSPGYSRLWTKKRPLAPRSPGTPKPALLQWARGLEGLRTGSPAVPAGLCSSSWVPSSPGRALCLWRPQGPSARPPECPPLLSARGCTREPGPAAAATLSLRDSSAPVAPGADQFLDASVAVEEETRWGPPFPVLPPASCPVPERAQSRLGLSSLEFQAHRLDALDVSSAHVLPQSDSPLRKAESKKRPKKVSQIRIRKTIPRPDPNLTPMGLPRPKRLKKTEFSLEEIYTNQNYKSPPATRCLETIFEEPKERNGSLISISHQKRKRVLEFQDFTVPRKRKARGRVKVAGSFTRAQKATLEGQELDVLLIQKLMDLEAFFAEHEEEQKRDVPGS